MDPIKFLRPDIHGRSEIVASSFDNPQRVNPHLSVTTKKISNLNFLDKFVMWVSEKIFGKEFVKLNSSDGPRLLKISDLTQKLGMTKQQILDTEVQGNLEEMIKLGVEAKTYSIPFSTIMRYKDAGQLEELRYMEFMADSLYLPLRELLIAKENKTLNEYLKGAQEVENKCYETFKKLDELYSEVEGKIITRKGESFRAMSLQELDTIKSVVRSACKILAQHPKGRSDFEQVVSVNKDYYFLVKSSPESYKITGLFGSLIGRGTMGIAAKTLDILNGSWSKGSEAVLKMSQVTDENSDQIIQEGFITGIINKGGYVLGVQKPLRIIRDVFAGSAKHCHLGPEYQTDLSNIIFDPDSKFSLSTKDKISFGYQMIYGVAHAHRMKITHGDIKPANVFCDLDFDGEKGPLLFLSNFGGALDHTSSSIPLQIITTEEYRQKLDDIISLDAYNAKDRDLYFEIEAKADIFATCSVICSIFTYLLPTEEDVKSKDLIMDPLLPQQLADAGLSPETVHFLVQGLDIFYKKRPDAATLLAVIRNDLALIDPERSKLLLALSQPL